MATASPLEIVFPKLAGSGYQITSPASLAYNCIAWAVGDSHRRYDPAPGFDWPNGIPRSTEMATAVALFANFGFEAADSGGFEAGFDKIALYASAGHFTHVARLLPTGRWTSKLGSQVDIEHGSPDDLSGPIYGDVICFMRRKQHSEESPA